MTENAASTSPSPRSDPGKRGDNRLLSGAHFVPAAILAGGTVLYAMNLYFTAALMPSIVEDIGGQQLFAWVATGFLIAAVIASTLAARSIAALGARGAYLVGFCGFALGSAAAALSGSMEVFVASRVLQGLGGGLLAGLGYAVIRSALPQKLWLKAAALVSAMWGIGALVGPSLGGMFGNLGRGARRTRCSPASRSCSPCSACERSLAARRPRPSPCPTPPSPRSSRRPRA